MELKILYILRKSPHRVSLRKILENLNSLYQNVSYNSSIVRIGIKSLLDKGYIKQDGRDTVSWENLDATFYTRKEKREEIDEKLNEFGLMHSN